MSITTPAGFVAAGMSAGIKASGDLDLALVATADGRSTATAATFTSNRAAAAPVQVSRDHLGSHRWPSGSGGRQQRQCQCSHRGPGAAPTPSGCAS